MLARGHNKEFRLPCPALLTLRHNNGSFFLVWNAKQSLFCFYSCRMKSLLQSSNNGLPFFHRVALSLLFSLSLSPEFMSLKASSSGREHHAQDTWWLLAWTLEWEEKDTTWSRGKRHIMSENEICTFQATVIWRCLLLQHDLGKADSSGDDTPMNGIKTHRFRYVPSLMH